MAIGALFEVLATFSVEVDTREGKKAPGQHLRKKGSCVAGRAGCCHGGSWGKMWLKVAESSCEPELG